MHSVVTAPALAVWRVGAPKQSLPYPVRKPPGRPPGEPIIIIKYPPGLPEVPEIDGSLDEEDDPEIKKAVGNRPRKASASCTLGPGGLTSS